MNPNLYRRILRNLAGGEGAGAPQHPLDLNILPEDLRREPSLGNIKTIPDLAKSFVSAQKMIGSKRVAIPGDNATPQELNDFYTQIGRPDAPEKYGMPEIEVDPAAKPDANRLKEFQKVMHDSGMTAKQGRAIMEFYMKGTDAQIKTARTQSEGAQATAVQGLRTEWGDKFDANLEVAQSVVKKFGDDSLKEYLDKSGMGNNIALIKLLHKFGSSIMDDRERGNSNTLNLSDQTRAQQEITSLKQNKEFQAILGDSRATGHADAVNRWMELHKVAHPGKQSEDN